MTTGGDCGRCGKWFETQCYDDQGYGDCPECIEKLKAEQPTPQNREADMPDVIWIDTVRHEKDPYWDFNGARDEFYGGTKYTRASTPTPDLGAAVEALRSIRTGCHPQFVVNRIIDEALKSLGGE